MLKFACKKWKAARAARKERMLLRGLEFRHRRFNDHMLKDIGIFRSGTDKLTHSTIYRPWWQHGSVTV